jgi:hypothetical protein
MPKDFVKLLTQSCDRVSQWLLSYPVWLLATASLTIEQAALGVSATGTALPFPPAQSSPAAKSETATAKAIVPFELTATNHMLVAAWINNKGPYQLVFDLGAPITLLSNRASEATGVVNVDAPRSFLFGMRGEAQVHKLEVGKLTVSKLPVIVLDHPILKALEEATGRRIDGIMGFTFFARYKTTIDYRAREMAFEPTSYAARDVLKELPDRLLGRRITRHRILAPQGMWGFRATEPTDGLNSIGVPVAEVYQGSPAERAGLKVRDVIITLDGRWTTSVLDLFSAAADVAPERPVTVIIQRDGKEQSLLIQPAHGA